MYITEIYEIFFTCTGSKYDVYVFIFFCCNMIIFFCGLRIILLRPDYFGNINNIIANGRNVGTAYE